MPELKCCCCWKPFTVEDIADANGSDPYFMCDSCWNDDNDEPCQHTEDDTQPCPHCGAGITRETDDPTCEDETLTHFWKCLWCEETFTTQENIFESGE